MSAPARETQAEALERLRGEIEARMEQAIAILGTQNFKAWAAGLEWGVVMRWCKRHG